MFTTTAWSDSKKLVSIDRPGKESSPDRLWRKERWHREPPLGFADGPNKYRYAGNDPINFRDPTGLKAAGNPLSTLGRVVAKAAATAVRATNPLLSATVDAGIGIASSLINGGPTGLKSAGATGAQVTPAQEWTSPFVREVVPGVPIVPQDSRNLPGLLQPLANPDRFQVANHQGQGYFVVDTKDGSARFVTGEEYLPIDSRAFLASEAANDASGRDQFLKVVQEGLVAVSPLHETGRDLGITLFGHDFVEPNQQFSTRQRVDAAFFLMAPGGNSQQVRYADEVIEGAQQIRLFDLGPLQRGKYAELDPRLLPKGRQGLPYSAEVLDALPGTSATTLDLAAPSY